MIRRRLRLDGVARGVGAAVDRRDDEAGDAGRRDDDDEAAFGGVAARNFCITDFGPIRGDWWPARFVTDLERRVGLAVFNSTPVSRGTARLRRDGFFGGGWTALLFLPSRASFSWSRRSSFSACRMRFRFKAASVRRATSAWLISPTFRFEEEFLRV